MEYLLTKNGFEKIELDAESLAEYKNNGSNIFVLGEGYQGRGGKWGESLGGINPEFILHIKKM